MDQEWNALVKEGKEIAGRKDKDQWHLGDLADRVTKAYGSDHIGKYAQEIGQIRATLIGCRSTHRAWKDKKNRHQFFSVCQDLNAHPDREEIVRTNPRVTSPEARAIVKEWRNAQPPKSSKNSKKALPEGPLNHRQLENEIEKRVQERIDDWMQKFRPHLDAAKAVQSGRKGLITKEEDMTIRRCLHPDNSASQTMLNKAFIVWQRIEHLLMNEQDAPTIIDFQMRRRKAHG